MKRLFTFIAIFLTLCAFTQVVSAQTFTMASDTEYVTNPSGTYNKIDALTPTSSCVTINWRVVNCTFPADWQPGIGVCDNYQCYPLSSLWTSGTAMKSRPYCALGDFHLQINLDAATTLGCYMLQARLTDSANVSDNATVTFMVCKTHPTDVPTIKQVSDVVLYPNPANNEINIVYDAGMDVSNVAVYNIIGKMMSVYKVAGNSANLSLDNMPSGVYFVRLVNSQGNVVSTKKFTKQ